jgi:hypothetical protein
MVYAEFMNTKVFEKFNTRVPKGDFGIEIETEGAGLPEGKITAEFVGKADGSLRNGMEYVSNPLAGKEVHLAVENLRWALDKKGARVNPSYRSSTHIHVNYADRTFKDVLGTLVVWSLVEPVAFRLLPPGRDGSLFCVPSYDTGELSSFVDRFCTDVGRNFYNGFNPRGKYSSLNLTRLGPGEGNALGTLEYRIFPTSLDGKTISQWCTWLRNIRDVVAAEEDPSFLTCVRRAEAEPKEFLSKVFGECEFDREVAGQLVDFGARTAFEMARVIQRHVKEKPKTREKQGKPAADDAFFMNVVAAGGAGGAGGAGVGGANFGLNIPAAEVAAQPAVNFRPGLGFARRRERQAQGGAAAAAQGANGAVPPRPRRVGLGGRRRPVPPAPQPEPPIAWADRWINDVENEF